MKRVVVTGIGAVSPLGNSFSQSWEAVKAGRSGIEMITRFDASHLQWKTTGELKGFDPEIYLSLREMNRLDPFVQYAVAAAMMAVEDAGLLKQSLVNSHLSSEKTNYLKTNDQCLMTNDKFVNSSLDSAGVIIGSSRGGITTIERELQKFYGSRFTVHGSRFSPYLMPSTTVSMAASYAAQKLRIKGHCLGISNACASGTNAIGEAFRLIKSGYASVVLAGGTEAPVCRLCIEGYGIADALSKHPEGTSVPRPFDTKRDGFVLSEGACVLVLEDHGHALKRGVDIYGEITGYGCTTDAFHMTRPDPVGEAKAMIVAIDEAGITPDRVDYINTHGTATKIGDIAETQAINIVFGQRASVVPATATKSMTGHMLAASGALEVASALMAMREGIIPPTINLEEKDPACNLNIVTERTGADIRVAISNSFGFGGVNAVIVLRRI